MAEPAVAAAGVIRSKAPQTNATNLNDWFVAETGDHSITPYRHHFTNLDFARGFQPHHLDDGTLLPTAGVGTVAVKFGRLRILLLGVLYVPGATRNVLSAGQFHNQGADDITLCFGEDQLEILRDGQVLDSGESIGDGVYRLVSAFDPKEMIPAAPPAIYKATAGKYEWFLNLMNGTKVSYTPHSQLFVQLHQCTPFTQKKSIGGVQWPIHGVGFVKLLFATGQLVIPRVFYVPAAKESFFSRDQLMEDLGMVVRLSGDELILEGQAGQLVARGRKEGQRYRFTTMPLEIPVKTRGGKKKKRPKPNDSEEGMGPQWPNMTPKPPSDDEIVTDNEPKNDAKNDARKRLRNESTHRSQKQPMNEWHLLSSYPTSISPHRELFTKLNIIDDMHNLHTGYGENLGIHGVGCVSLQFGKWKLELEDVLYISSMEENILSIPQLGRLGFVHLKASDGMRIVNCASGKVVATYAVGEGGCKLISDGPSTRSMPAEMSSHEKETPDTGSAVTALAKTTPDESNSLVDWTLSFTATISSTANRSLFSSFNTTNPFTDLGYIPGSPLLGVSGVGPITLLFTNGKEIRLPKVFYIRTATKNVLSVKQLKELGYWVSEHCILKAIQEPGGATVTNAYHFGKREWKIRTLPPSDGVSMLAGSEKPNERKRKDEENDPSGRKGKEPKLQSPFTATHDTPAMETHRGPFTGTSAVAMNPSGFSSPGFQGVAPQSTPYFGFGQDGMPGTFFRADASVFSMVPGGATGYGHPAVPGGFYQPTGGYAATYQAQPPGQHAPTPYGSFGFNGVHPGHPWYAQAAYGMSMTAGENMGFQGSSAAQQGYNWGTGNDDVWEQRG